MSEQHQPENVQINNQLSLERLSWTIQAGAGKFKLILARCNYAQLRNSLISRLREICPVEISILYLKPFESSLYTAIQEEIGENVQALMIVGLETLHDLPQMLTSANQVREEFRQNFSFPLVLWINDEIYIQMMQLAPDLESWSTTRKFALSNTELNSFIQQIATQLFDNSFNVSKESLGEIKSAWQDLESDGQSLQPDLKANCDFLLGYIEAIHKNFDAAIEYYCQSLVVWQESNNLERQGKILNQITFCYYEKSQQLSANQPLTSVKIEKIEVAAKDEINQQIRNYLQQSLEVLESASRPDIIADSIDKTGIVLRYLQDWQQLKLLAERALNVHEASENPLKIAQDYGFLAEVALAEEEWQLAKELAEKALTVLSSANQSASTDLMVVAAIYQRQELLLILSTAQQHLSQDQEAINNLSTARELGVSDKDPQLYLDILGKLQKLLFQEQQYLSAFNAKLEARSVEQQFGLRAFIGAGRLQAAKQIKKPGIVSLKVENQDGIAPEIAASGRQLDVERLTERIGRLDYKLIVIHGQSGVGKSSLVNAGLVPALKNKPIGVQDNLVVVMRVYTNWVEELSRIQMEALQETRVGWGVREQGSNGESVVEVMGREAQVSPLDSEVQTSHSLVSTDTLLTQIRENEKHNLRTVLIFDQFEEFFFVYTAPQERRQFFDFLGQCLNILSMKVILSLRVDYLHYLLEYNHLSSLKIISNDILSNNVLYKLGNFSPSDAKSIIQRLTEKTSFYLEPALVNQLVEDLASELKEVRPIELQVVGAQLQTENIRTLAKYQEYGRNAKEELVKRYLAEVVDDCGVENKLGAELLLYLLTDEKGTRPLKTRAEIERDLKALAADVSSNGHKLDLVLEIFVKSGLVVLLPENPFDRYQLVHDYLAAFIRQQQQPKLNELMAELERERKKNLLAQEQRQLVEQQLKQSEQAQQILAFANQKATQRIRLGSGVLGISLVLAGIAAFLANQAYHLSQEAQTGTRLERQGMTAWQYFPAQEIEPLLLAMQAGQELQGLVKDKRPLEEYPAASPQLALQTILDNIHEQNQLKGHTGSVISASFSPDGKRIVTASYDNTARVWDISGKQLAELKGHTGSVYSASFSPDGKRIVTASIDNTARVWDISGKQLAELKGHTGSVYSASFSPDGKRIVTASYDNTARVWDISGKQLAELKGHTSLVYSASFSPDGKRIVTASDDNTARVWDISGKQLAELKGHTGSVYSASFSPDGKRIVTASDDNTARVWDISGKQLAELKGHTGSVYSASFSPDGKRIVTASDDNTARVWDISGKQLAELKGHTGSVYSASFSPDGKRIVTASYDNTARVWDISGKQLAELKGHTSLVYSASFSPDGKRIVTASDDNTARVWDISGKQLAELKGHTGSVYSASFSPDGKRIVTASIDNTARVWDISGKQLAELKGHTSLVYRASFSPDGKRIVTASDDNTARVWDISGKQLAELKGHTSLVYRASFSPDGKRIVTASSDNTARVWDISGKQLAELKGHTGSVISASFSPDGKRIVTASYDNTARVWDISGKQLAELKGHTGIVISASFSPDGKRIVTASDDNTARVWDISGKQLAELKGHTGIVISASFSPDGKRIVTASYDKTARVWDISGKQLAELKGHTGIVISASFSPDGKRIVTASDDNTARVWDISGKQLAELKGHTGSVISASFSPDGKRIVTASYDNTARVWRVDNLDELLSRGCQWLNDYLVFNPQDLQTLTVCQNQSNLMAAAPFLVTVGENEARAGNIDNALTTFQTALKWNPNLKFDPKVKATEFANKGQAERLIQEGERIVQESHVKEAVADYDQAQKLDPKVEISADSWNTLCRQGSLREQAHLVMFACDKAVNLQPDNGTIHDSRGLARALTGDTQGAIADFEAYIAQVDDQDTKAQRRRWVKDLKAAKNPFTDAELGRLLK